MESFIMAEFRRDQYNRIVKNFEGFSKIEIRKMIVRAADRTASAGVTATKRGIANEFGISKSALGKAVKKYKYGSGLGMAIGVKIRDNPRPLSEFKFGPKKHGARPVVEVKKGSSKVLDGPFFVAVTKKGHRTTILERTNEAKYPAKESLRGVWGPSAVGMFKANESIHKTVWDIIFDKFEERVIHEIDRELKGGKS